MYYDSIIIGKGPAGLSASIYIARGNLKPLIIGKESVLIKGKRIENYCCTDPSSGEDLIQKGVEQAASFGVEMVEEEVIDIKKKEEHFLVQTDQNQYEGKTVIIATGKARTQVPIENIKKFEGKGVHYCVACDGFFYVDSKVGILGYKDYAVHELREFENTTKDVALYTNGNPLEIGEESRRYLEEKKIPVYTQKIKAVEGQEFLEKILFEDGKTAPIQGLFVAYGSASSADFARKLGIMMDKDIIKVDEDQKTNVEGVFAAGDCTGGLAQVATAVGQGAVAGQKVKSYIQTLKK